MSPKEKEIQRLELEIKACKAENSALQMYLDDFPDQVAYGNDLNGVQGAGMSYDEWLDNKTTQTHQNGKSSTYGTTMQERFYAKMEENEQKLTELERELEEVRAKPDSEFEQPSEEVTAPEEVTEPEEVTTPTSSPESFVSTPSSYSTYYADQLVKYNENYDSAKTKVTNMITKLTALYDSFDNASGNDITKIRADLEALINSLNTIKETITKTQQKTNDNAASCQRCYVNWTNKEKYTDIYIDDADGHVCGTEVIPDEHEYRDPSLLEIILGISTARAEGITQYIFHKATIEEMLNS